jgi:hypothetical protein
VVECLTYLGKNDAGCNGGEITDAFDFIIDNGTVPEQIYPYNDAGGKCSPQLTNASFAVGHINKYYNVTGPNGTVLSLPLSRCLT